MKRRFMLYALIGLFMSLFLFVFGRGQTQSPTKLCQPNLFGVKSQYTEVTLPDQSKLTGRFYYPDGTTYPPGDDVQFDENSLSGVVVIHGTNLKGTDYSVFDASSEAARLAKNCMVTLAVNFVGQGPHSDVNSEYTWLGDNEQDALSALLDHVMDGPIPGTLDLVDDDSLGIIGFSQGGAGGWQTVADYDLRGKVVAAVPHDGPFMTESWLVPNECINGHIAPFFDPESNRTPWPDEPPYPDPTEAGISWDDPLYPDLLNAYVTSHPPLTLTVEAVVDARATYATALAITPTPGGTEYPHVYYQSSWYDQWQNAQEGITAYQVIASPTVTTTRPPQAVYVGAAPVGHGDPPWVVSDAERLRRVGLRSSFLWEWLKPAYNPSPTPPATPVSLTPRPTWTPTPAVYPVEYAIDRYLSAYSTQTPEFSFVTAEYWPPPSTPITLYLQTDGRAITVTPSVNDVYTTVVQSIDLGDPAYNMATAVAEFGAGEDGTPTPAFNSLDPTSQNSLLTLTRRYFVSPPLAQPVILAEPPEVRLYAEPDPGSGVTSYQVHVRVLEELDAANLIRPVIVRANACAWAQAATPSYFGGEPFQGTARAHRFQAGRRIVIELTTVDDETYGRSHSTMFMTPYLNSFTMRVYHALNKPTSVRLNLIPNNNNNPIFEAEAGSESLTAQPVEPPLAAVPTPTATPVSEPLTLTAAEWPDFTNAGGWRIWSPQVYLECHGGDGKVACPADTILATEGISQTFTFTATDESNTVVTATLQNVSIDLTPPELSESLPDNQTFCSNATLPVDFSLSDALSGVAASTATFNGIPVTNHEMVTLAAGANVLQIHATDVAGNGVLAQATLQVNYNTTLDFPDDGQTANPLLPLPFAFQVNDACAAQGWYNGAAATLWLVSPNSVEQPAEWYGVATGNSFVLNSLTGWYEFDADLSGLAAGTWTARADLDDGTSRSVTFVIPAAGPNAQDTITLPTFDCAADLARNGRFLGGCR